MIEEILTTSSIESATVSIVYGIVVSLIALDIKGGQPRNPLSEKFSTNTYAIYATLVAALLISAFSGSLTDVVSSITTWGAGFPIINKQISSLVLALLASAGQIHILSDRNIKLEDLVPDFLIQILS